MSVAELVALRTEASTCTRCPLADGRTQIVFGSGNVVQPPIAFVGEAPRADEDEAGLPFIGNAGRLLDELIVWMGYERAHVYVLNSVLCRTPGNRMLRSIELEACQEHLEAQLKIVRPRVLVALGRTAANAILSNDLFPLESLRGVWHETPHGKTRVTYHPSYILRNPAAKARVYEDLAAVRHHLDLLL